MSYIQLPQPVLYTSGGMSLRDYFAGLAMQSYFNMLASSDLSACRHYAEIAQEAFNIADAMLAEREKEVQL